MRKLFYSVTTAAALALGSTGANAVPVILSPTTVSTPPGTLITPPATAIFGNTFGTSVTPVPDGTEVHDVFTFTITGAPGALTDATLNTILLNSQQNIDFGCARTCSIFFDTNIAENTFHLITASNPEVWALTTPINLTAGLHNLFVNGVITAGPTAGYSGVVNFNLAPPAVPEPGTWAMMLLGFGAIGLAMRHRRRAAVSIA